VCGLDHSGDALSSTGPSGSPRSSAAGPFKEREYRTREGQGLPLGCRLRLPSRFRAVCRGDARAKRSKRCGLSASEASVTSQALDRAGCFDGKASRRHRRRETFLRNIFEAVLAPSKATMGSSGFAAARSLHLLPVRTGVPSRASVIAGPTCLEHRTYVSLPRSLDQLSFEPINFKSILAFQEFPSAEQRA